MENIMNNSGAMRPMERSRTMKNFLMVFMFVLTHLTLSGCATDTAFGYGLTRSQFTNKGWVKVDRTVSGINTAYKRVKYEAKEFRHVSRLVARHGFPDYYYSPKLWSTFYGYVDQGKIYHVKGGRGSSSTIDTYHFSQVPTGLPQDIKYAFKSSKTQRNTIDNKTVNTQGTKKQAKKINHTTKAIQQKLADLGFKVGTPDGVDGKNTKSAISSYQEQMGLPVDGKASKALLAKLNAPMQLKHIAKTKKSITNIVKNPVISKTQPNKQELALKRARAEAEKLKKELAALKQNKIEKEKNKHSNVDFGNYYALVIGIDDYELINDLKTAVHDARTVANLLEKEFGFKVKRLENSSRQDILSALNKYRNQLSKNDNLLIYFAGHGLLDKEKDSGYWLPREASIDDDVDWIPLDRVTKTIRAINAKHVMVVADSCFSGKLTRGIHVKYRAPDYYSKMAKTKARVVMTSGGLEPVLDSGGDGHSVFASAFIRSLKETGDIIDGTDLFSKVRRRVMLDANQKPEYSDMGIRLPQAKQPYNIRYSKLVIQPT
jgi:peptidoglycan hydrolase-like protein with peptidoglycan-binding domain